MVRRHVTVLLIVAALAAIAVWLHPCDVAGETRTGVLPARIAPRNPRSDSDVTRPRGVPWIWHRTG